MKPIKNYIAHIDNKNRVTIRGAKYDYYNVKEFKNGCIILEPKELITPEEISKDEISTIEKILINYEA